MAQLWTITQRFCTTDWKTLRVKIAVFQIFNRDLSLRHMRMLWQAYFYVYFSGDHCDKSFRQKSHLDVHLAAVRGDRPFECDICHKTYPKHSTLKVGNFKNKKAFLFKANYPPPPSVPLPWYIAITWVRKVQSFLAWSFLWMGGILWSFLGRLGPNRPGGQKVITKCNKVHLAKLVLCTTGKPAIRMGITYIKQGGHTTGNLLKVTNSTGNFPAA